MAPGAHVAGNEPADVVYDPALKPEAKPDLFKAMDEAKISWFHIKAVVIAGMGFFTDAYDLFSIGLLTKLIGKIYYPSGIPLNVNSAITGVALCGTFAGQLFFGFMGDRIGRKACYGLTLWCMVSGALASGLSFGRTPEAVVGSLCFFRFFLGFGVGGDYPLSAVIMSEYSSRSSRGAFVAAVFAMQGMGYLTAATVTLITAKIFIDCYPQDAQHADYVWRVVLMFAAVPTAATMYARAKMPETPRYTIQVAGDKEKAQKDMKGVLGYSVFVKSAAKKHSGLGQFVRQYKWKLLGCSMTWFLLDISFYSQGLFQSTIYSAVGWVPNIKVYWKEADTSANFFLPYIPAKSVCNTSSWEIPGLGSTAATSIVKGTAKCPSNKHLCHDQSKTTTCWMTPLEQTYLFARAQAIIALGSVIPGYWFTVFTIEYIGRWWIQMGGFFFMTLFMAILAGDYNHLLKNTSAFITLYALTFFFANWGPNATTFVVPAEVFPSRWRSTGHGFCAAMGKAGAIVGAFGFLYASKDPHNPSDRALYGNKGIGLQKTLGILAAINFVGMLFTFLVPETKGQSLEQLAGEGEWDKSNVANEQYAAEEHKAPGHGAHAVPAV